MATIEKSFDAGLHSEQLSGRTQEIFFSAEEDENFVYPYNAFQVDSSKKTEFDAQSMESTAINQKIRDLMKEGFGHIVVQNPRAKHSIGVGILNRLQLDFEGSLGYFGCGLIDGPNIRISGRVGWSFAENMMGGTIAVITAVLVVNPPSNPEWIWWVLPTALIVPVIFWWNNQIL